MDKQKKIDAVDLTRKIRNKLSKAYYKNSNRLYSDLELIKKKYIVKENSESYNKEINNQKG